MNCFEIKIKIFTYLTGESVSFLTTNEIFDGIFRRSIEILDANPLDGLTPS
jgi:hypothetical protein